MRLVYVVFVYLRYFYIYIYIVDVNLYIDKFKVNIKYCFVVLYFLYIDIVV